MWYSRLLKKTPLQGKRVNPRAEAYPRRDVGASAGAADIV
jgi:hypothetical protein